MAMTDWLKDHEAATQTPPLQSASGPFTIKEPQGSSKPTVRVLSERLAMWVRVAGEEDTRPQVLAALPVFVLFFAFPRLPRRNKNLCVLSKTRWAVRKHLLELCDEEEMKDAWGCCRTTASLHFLCIVSNFWQLYSLAIRWALWQPRWPCWLVLFESLTTAEPISMLPCLVRMQCTNHCA